MSKKEVSSNNRKIAMQHQQLSKNTLFGYGRPKLEQSTHLWEGDTTVQYPDKEGLTKVPCHYKIDALASYRMDAKDQLLFLNLLYLMRFEKKRSAVKTPTSLRNNGWRLSKDTLQLNTSFNELCRVMGIKSSGANVKAIKERLTRLSRVHLVCEVKRKKPSINTRSLSWTSNLIDWEIEETGNLMEKNIGISMPSILAAAAFKQGMQLSTSHNLEDLRHLSSEGMLLATALCSRIRSGNSARYKLTTVIEFFQFEKSTLLKKRRYIVKKAITELEKQTSWQVHHEVENDIYKFRRPQLLDIESE